MKRYTIVFDELAKMELEDACKYYDCEVPGLGNRFKQEIKRGIQRVRGFPYTWPVEKGDIRRYICHTFPYKILYSIEKQKIGSYN